MTEKTLEFCRVFEVWPVAHDYLDVMFSSAEIELVLAFDGRAGTSFDVSGWLGLGLAETDQLLERSYRRCILDKEEIDGLTRFRVASFYDFLDYFAKYENWDELPLDVRRSLDKSFLQAFVARVRENVTLKMVGQAPAGALPNDSVMLLFEVEAMIDAATDIIVQPCDCRRLGQYCDRPVNTCIWLDELARTALDRGHGERISREEAIRLLRYADKEGLMHTADHNWQANGLHAICNCCACDCYPFRAAQQLGSKEVWPQARYVVVYQPDLCSLCGVCVKRCHFEAFYYDGGMVAGVGGRGKPTISLDPHKCWGCGLCVNTCPTEAITLCKLAD